VDVTKAGMKLPSSPPTTTTTMMTSRFPADINLASHNHHIQNNQPPPMSELSAQLRQPTPQITHRCSSLDLHHTSTMEKAVVATAIDIIHTTTTNPTTMAAKTPSPLPTAAPKALLPSGSRSVVQEEEEEESGYILIHSPRSGLNGKAAYGRREFTPTAAAPAPAASQQKTDQIEVMQTGQAAVVVEGLFVFDDEAENTSYSKKEKGNGSKKKVQACGDDDDDVIAQWKDDPAQHLVIVARGLATLAGQYNKHSNISSRSIQLSAERSYENKKAQFALQLAALQVLKYNDNNNNNKKKNKAIIGKDGCRVTLDESSAASILEAAKITATELSKYTSSTSTSTSTSSSPVLPNPWVMLYNAGLEWAHEAALDELLCQYNNSYETYLLTLAIFYFYTTDCVSSAIWKNADGQVAVGVDQDVLKKHVVLVNERCNRVHCQLSNRRLV
jgi:hypothetical protein